MIGVRTGADPGKKLRGGFICRSHTVKLAQYNWDFMTSLGKLLGLGLFLERGGGGGISGIPMSLISIF